MTISIKDVARAAGVAPSTVSRALGKGPVSAEVRAQVAAAVVATGYRPNLSARRLRSRRTMTVGLVLADIRNPFFTQLGRAVEDAAYRAGMRVFLCNTDEDPAREAMYVSLMAEERVSGLILAPTGGMAPGAVAALNLPVVLVDRDLPGSGCDSVLLDNRAAAEMLVDHLVATGRRRIRGLFGATSATGADRHLGYEAAMRRHGLVPEARLAAPNAAAGREALMAGLLEGADSLILSNGLFLEAAVTLARQTGLTVPGDLALAGFDDETWTALVDPGLTVIRQPVDTIGREAMAMLLARMETPTLPARRLVLGGELVARGSTANR